MCKDSPSLAPVLLSLLLLASAVAASAENEGSFSGEIRLGYRSVDVGGTQTKFKEDINLEDGPRLFGLRFDLVPSEDLRAYADRVELDVSNFGGDPFETFSFSAVKYGRYDFNFRRTESAYFYEDIILPLALAEPSLSNGGDFHTFDFERVRDTASLKLRLSPQAKLNFGLERFTKRGESTTTLDIQRDEFELDRPIDESYNETRVGFEYAWSKATLVLEERYREYENLVEIFLPGFSLGEDPFDATTLDFFFLDQPYDYESLQHTVRLNCRPTEKLLIRTSALVQDLDLDLHAEERVQGNDFRGDPFAGTTTGAGEIDRESELFDVDVSYLLSDRVALTGGLRQHRLDQEGRFPFGSNVNVGAWDIETTGIEAGVEVSVSPRLTLAGGLRAESRDVEFGHGEDGVIELETESTDHEGFYASLGYRPSERVRLEASIEDSSYDHPFTLTSPTDRQRFRLSGRYQGEEGLYAQGTALLNRFENDVSGWTADIDQLSLRLGWRRPRLDASVGYSAIETDRKIDQLVTTAPGFGGGVTFLFPVFYEADADFVDGRLRFRSSERLTVGGDLRLYDNSGSFALARDDLRVYAEIGFLEDYLLYLGYRTIDYDEDASNFDDYDADVAELAVGYRW